MLRQVTDEGWPYTMQALAHDHCLYHNLGAADWVAYLDGLDAYYLNALPQTAADSSERLPDALARLRSMHPREQPLCAASVRRCDFGGPRFGAGRGGPAQAFRRRVESCSENGPFERDDPVIAGDGSALYALWHRAVCRPDSRMEFLAVHHWRANHYIDAVKSRCGTRCRLLDAHMALSLTAAGGAAMMT